MLEKFDNPSLTEFKLLISCVSIVINGTTTLHKSIDEWQQAFSNCKLNKLLELAHFHGTLPWLQETLKRLNKADLSDKALGYIETIATQYKILQFQNTIQCQQSEHVCNLLSQAQIKHLSFKGITVLKQFYQPYASCRLADDLDLLVAPKDLTKAVEVLLDNNYLAREDVAIKRVANFVSHHAQHYRWRDLGLITKNKPTHKIDLHWALADQFSLPTNTEFLLENRVIYDKEKKLYTLPFTLHFVYICIHGHSDYFFRLRNLIDLYTAMKNSNFDRTKVLSCAQEHGVKQPVLESIELAELLFDSKLITTPAQYNQCTLNRYTNNMGWTKRAHPNTSQWTRTDKWQHLKRQIQQRSKNVSSFAPIIARSKLDLNDAEEWRGESIPFYRFKRTLKKLI